MEIKERQGVDEQTITEFEGKLKDNLLPDLEPDVVGQLPSTAGAHGEDTESERGERKLGIPTV